MRACRGPLLVPGDVTICFWLGVAVEGAGRGPQAPAELWPLSFLSLFLSQDGPYRPVL
jgi:hypothetical protein